MTSRPPLFSTAAGAISGAGAQSTLDGTRELLTTQAALLNATADLVSRFSRRRLLRRRWRQQAAVRREAAEHAVEVKTMTPRLLVLGIISNPRTPHTRDWIRSTYKAVPVASVDGEALVRFVMGRRGLSSPDRSKLKVEHRKHRDLEFIDASDFAERGGIFSCIDKLFAWFPHAFTTFPGASFYAKADDDSYVDVRQLVRMLRPLAPLRNAYLGYVQYDSFLPAEWKHCGWAAGPIGAAHAFRHGCRHPDATGPFPFVVGALTVLGADLAGWMATSPYLHALVEAGRASQSEPIRHWDCGYSDVTLGYALASANLSVSLVAVRNAMRDATYGAMTAKRFVVSHHLRQKPQFVAAHAETTAAGDWNVRASPCAPWPEVWRHPSAPALHNAEGGEAVQLRAAMAAFGCCQRWSVCEVSPDL